MAARWRDDRQPCHGERDEHGRIPGPGDGYVGGGDFSNSGTGGHNPGDRHHSDRGEGGGGE